MGLLFPWTEKIAPFRSNSSAARLHSARHVPRFLCHRVARRLQGQVQLYTHDVLVKKNALQNIVSGNRNSGMLMTGVPIHTNRIGLILGMRLELLHVSEKQYFALQAKQRWYNLCT